MKLPQGAFALSSILISFGFSVIFSSTVHAQSVTVNLKLSPAGSFQAQTSSVVGKVQVIGGNVKAQSIKVSLATLKTGIKLRDDHMKEKYLDVKKFPNAELTLAEGSGGKGKGKLKIHGIEKDIEGQYQVNGKMLEAKFEIQLSDFDIKGIRYMGVGVKDTAEVIAAIPVQ